MDIVVEEMDESDDLLTEYKMDSDSDKFEEPLKGGSHLVGRGEMMMMMITSSDTGNNYIAVGICWLFCLYAKLHSFYLK
jgi:hypothetical protein